MPPHILVVDDDPSIRTVFQLALESEGYNVAVAEHGKAALDRISERAPQVILLDIRMPVMDGRTFADEYHSQPGPHAPIVLVTARSQTDLPIDNIGAAAILLKPCDINLLLAKVATLAATSPTPGE